MPAVRPARSGAFVPTARLLTRSDPLQKNCLTTGELATPDERKLEQALEQKPVKFETFATGDFLTWSKTNHSAGHASRIEIALKVHLVPFFKNYHLHEITPNLIEDYKTSRHRLFPCHDARGGCPDRAEMDGSPRPEDHAPICPRLTRARKGSHPAASLQKQSPGSHHG
jgi:hypothetical protein